MAARTTSTDKLREACMLARTPAEFARVLDQPGKWVRDILRKQGTYVSKGAPFDDAAKAALFDACMARIAKRTVAEAGK